MTDRFDITLLTQDDCAFCTVAREVLDRVGREFPLQVKEIALATDEGRALATTAGVLFAPGVLIDGEAFSYGRLSERKLRRALEKRRTDA